MTIRILNSFRFRDPSILWDLFGPQSGHVHTNVPSHRVGIDCSAVNRFENKSLSVCLVYIHTDLIFSRVWFELSKKTDTNPFTSLDVTQNK